MQRVTLTFGDELVAEIDPAELDWDTIFAGASAFHVTGITPALSDSAAAAAITAVMAFQAGGMMSSP